MAKASPARVAASEVAPTRGVPPSSTPARDPEPARRRAPTHRRRGGTGGGSSGGRRGGGRGRGRPAGSTNVVVSQRTDNAGGSGGGGQPIQRQLQASGQSAGRSLGQVLAGGGRPPSTYTRLVALEFLVTMALIALAPVMIGPDDKAPKDLTQPFVRFAGTCAVFVVLALMTQGERAGRVAAAFGGLVMVVAIVNGMKEIQVIGRLFGSGS